MVFWNDLHKRKPLDVGAPVENPRLKTAFEKLRHYNTEYYLRKVLAEIKCANFLSIISTDGMTYAQIIAKKSFFEENQSVNFIGVQDDAGDWFQPLFTDFAEVQLVVKDNKDVRIITLDIRWIIETLLEESSHKGIVINPGSDKWAINREQMNFLLRHIL